VPGDAEMSDLRAVERGGSRPARLVIGVAALLLGSGVARGDLGPEPYAHVYDLGAEWKAWTGLPFVFAVWIARRETPVADALGVHASLIESRNWGLQHRDVLARQAHDATGVPLPECDRYLSGLDYGLSYPHLAGLTEFFRRLVGAGRVPNGTLAFLPAA